MELLPLMLEMLDKMLPAPLNDAQRDLVSLELKDEAHAFERRVDRQLRDFATKKGLIK